MKTCLGRQVETFKDSAFLWFAAMPRTEDVQQCESTYKELSGFKEVCWDIGVALATSDHESAYMRLLREQQRLEAVRIG